MTTVANSVRMPLADARPTGVMEQILSACQADQETFLDVLDATLCFGSTGNVSAPSLEQMLSMGGSVWKVRPDKMGLERRVSAEAQTLYEAASSPGDEASRELQEAWTAAFGRAPDASDAWDHAIKAVEELYIPLVVPKAAKSNLGSVAGELKANPAGWVLVLESNGALDSVATLEALFRLLWPNPDRHGGETRRTPSLGEAAAVVHLAVTLVQWARDGVLQKQP